MSAGRPNYAVNVVVGPWPRGLRWPDGYDDRWHVPVQAVPHPISLDPLRAWLFAVSPVMLRKKAAIASGMACAVAALAIGFAGLTDNRKPPSPSTTVGPATSPITPSSAPPSPLSARPESAPAAEAVRDDDLELKPDRKVGAADASPAYSRANIRYCMFEGARLAHIRPLATSGVVFDRFVAAANEYNAICGSYRYRESDRIVLEMELLMKQSQLRAEAAARIAGWRASEGAPALESEQSAYLPALPEVAQIPELRPALDLLNVDDAQRVQRRLAELGYFKGLATGAWGSISRAAMRWFNIVNGNGDTDRFNDLVARQLFSPGAMKAPSGGPPQGRASEEATYDGPDGADLNPINPDHAIRVHARLRELGTYSGQSDRVWTGSSRTALRLFKQNAGLAPDDVWDQATEAALFGSATALYHSAVDKAFEAAVVGTWATRPSDCSSKDREALITIDGQGASARGQGCQFQKKSGADDQWSVRAVCRLNADSWIANVKLVRTANMLRWTSEKGTALYYRCSQRPASASTTGRGGSS